MTEDASPAVAPPPRRAPGRGRAAGVLLLAAALTGACALPTWLSTTASSVLGADVHVTVSGGAAAPTLVAAALVLLAATGAIALVGRFGRWVVVASVALAGLLVVAGAVGVLRDAEAAAAPAVVDRTGVEVVVGGVHVTPWPWVALVVGVLDVLVALWLVRASSGWTVARRRAYEVPAGAPGTPSSPAARQESDEPDDERTQWDALSRGDDPT